MNTTSSLIDETVIDESGSYKRISFSSLDESGNEYKYIIVSGDAYKPWKYEVIRNIAHELREVVDAP